MNAPGCSYALVSIDVVKWPRDDYVFDLCVNEDGC
jgi:hypothetical protein